MFEIKVSKVPEFANRFVQELTSKVFNKSDVFEENIDLENDRSFSNYSNELKEDISDSHLAQLLSVIGTTSIKMLIYFEKLDNDLKRFGFDDMGGK